MTKKEDRFVFCNKEQISFCKCFNPVNSDSDKKIVNTANCSYFCAKTHSVLDKQIIHQFIKNALAEDVGDGDHTSLSTIPAGTQGKARLIIKDTGILAGVELALEIFREVDANLKVNVLLNDGAEVKPGDIAFEVTGDVQSILVAERLVLNCMQRMSGIATTTNEVADLLQGTSTKVLDTRKTTPGLRYLEKWAVKIGGGGESSFRPV